MRALRSLRPSRGNSLLPFFLGLITILLLIVGILAWRYYSGGRPGGGGGAAPDLRLAALDGGRQVALSDFEGKVVLVDFWATWCGPCHLQARILEPLYQEFRARGVEFLAVSVGEDVETVREFVARNPYAYPVLVDPQDRVSQDLGIYALPTLMVVDRSGRIAYFQPGVTDAQSLRKILDDAARTS